MLQLDEIKQKLAEIKAQAKEAETALGIDALEKELASLRGQMEAPDFWTNVEQAGKVTKKAKPIEDKLDQFEKAEKTPRGRGGHDRPFGRGVRRGYCRRV